MLTVQREQTAKGHTVWRNVGELDAFSVRHFRRALADLAASEQVIIDLSQTAFVDSAGLGALIGGIRGTRERGGDVAGVCTRPALVRLLQATGFDRTVTLAPTVNDAAAALANAGSGRANPPTPVEPFDQQPTARWAAE